MYRPSFFFNDTATTEIYTLSLHDALPIYGACKIDKLAARAAEFGQPALGLTDHGVMNGAVELFKACRKHDVKPIDRKSTRLNSSHANISYAVFCLKKKTTVTCINSRHVSP